MAEYATFLKKMERPLVGRKKEISQLLACMSRPELCNAILLGDAGSGKTALVQGAMEVDKDRAYLEVDLPRMLSNLANANELAARLKSLFQEVEKFSHSENKEIVLFMDEFHQIVQLSPAAVEVLKPMLADSGTRGIRVIAATTNIEFQEFVSSNQPLVERLQRINITEPDKETVVAILRGMAKKYGVINQFPDDSMFELIYDYTNRYVPANAQPRKSILMLDSMIGWHRLTGRPMNLKMLSDVIFDTEGVNVSFRVDATTIKQRLDAVVLSQTAATRAIEERLQICAADLNNKDRPMSSFLFAGSTGVGKTETCKQLANILFGDARSFIRMDMTEYAQEDSMNRFRTELTTAVWARPYCVILLDEVEKACGSIIRLLLQVLDDGRLMDRNNREVTFKNAYIVMTTNAGSEVFKTIAQYSVDDTGSGAVLKEYNKLIREAIKSRGGNRFPPELLGRVDCLVPFQPLSEQTQMDICNKRLQSLKENVRKIHGLNLELDDKLTKFIVQDGLTTDSDSGGARSIVSLIETEITSKVAAYINAHKDTGSGATLVVQVLGQLASEDKNRLDSSARIVVKEKTPSLDLRDIYAKNVKKG